MVFHAFRDHQRGQCLGHRLGIVVVAAHPKTGRTASADASSASTCLHGRALGSFPMGHQLATMRPHQEVRQRIHRLQLAPCMQFMHKAPQPRRLLHGIGQRHSAWKHST